MMMPMGADCPGGKALSQEEHPQMKPTECLVHSRGYVLIPHQIIREGNIRRFYMQFFPS